MLSRRVSCRSPSASPRANGWQLSWVHGFVPSMWRRVCPRPRSPSTRSTPWRQPTRDTRFVSVSALTPCQPCQSGGIGQGLRRNMRRSWWVAAMPTSRVAPHSPMCRAPKCGAVWWPVSPSMPWFPRACSTLGSARVDLLADREFGPGSAGVRAQIDRQKAPEVRGGLVHQARWADLSMRIDPLPA